MTDTDLPNLAKRVEVIEKRLGIDPLAVIADEAASNAAGAEAHVGNAQSDVPAPAVPESVEDALTAANDAGSAPDALDHVVRALDKWPDNEDLLAAKADLEKVIAAEQSENEEPAQNAGSTS